MKIATLISGGVDSSTSLYLLQKQGFTPKAYYIKIWMEDDFFDCPWKEDLAFAKSVCKQLGIELEVVSMQKEYWDTIISYTLEEVKKGRTPNPDVFCNTFIKFGLFYETYGKAFDKIATGHYAQIQEKKIEGCKDIKIYLEKAKDPGKDQVYFLSQLSQEQVARCLFPIGGLDKSEVRKIAKEANLSTHNRPDSQGLCFLGKVNFKSFIKKYVGEKEGKFIDIDTKKEIGIHNGHWFYTIGQREGIGIGGTGKPLYVVGKKADENIVYVAKGHEHSALWKDQVVLEKLNILAEDLFNQDTQFTVQLRYHSSEIPVTLVKNENTVSLQLSQPTFGIASGQVGVLYKEDLVVASGIIQ